MLSCAAPRRPEAPCRPTRCNVPWLYAGRLVWVTHPQTIRCTHMSIMLGPVRSICRTVTYTKHDKVLTLVKSDSPSMFARSKDDPFDIVSRHARCFIVGDNCANRLASDHAAGPMPCLSVRRCNEPPRTPRAPLPAHLARTSSSNFAAKSRSISRLRLCAALPLLGTSTDQAGGVTRDRGR